VPLAARPSGDRAQPQTFNQKPDAELKGLSTLGVVVETLSSQATACGLSQETLETAASKTLSDAGFKILRNSDEDTYLYVDVITTRLPSGLCVSRYDASLYTHTTTKLTYQESPVLVQVSLLHQGGIAGGAPAAHAEGVLKGLQQYIDQFATRIRAANKYGARLSLEHSAVYAPPRPRAGPGLVSVSPFFAKIIASSFAASVWLAFFETSCVAPGGS
jgi:hypothetical protein